MMVVPNASISAIILQWTTKYWNIYHGLQAHGIIIWENFLDHKNVLGQTKLLYGHCFYEKLPKCPHTICGHTAPQ